jgi:hypothetical protein
MKHSGNVMWSERYEKLVARVATSWKYRASLGLTDDEIRQAARIGFFKAISAGHGDDEAYLVASANNFIRDTIPERALMHTKHQNGKLKHAVRVSRDTFGIASQDYDDGNVMGRARASYGATGTVKTDNTVSEQTATDQQAPVLVCGRVDTQGRVEAAEFLDAIFAAGKLDRDVAVAIFMSAVEGTPDSEVAQNTGLTVRNMRYHRTIYREAARALLKA